MWESEMLWNDPHQAGFSSLGLKAPLFRFKGLIGGLRPCCDPSSANAFAKVFQGLKIRPDVPSCSQQVTDWSRCRLRGEADIPANKNKELLFVWTVASHESRTGHTCPHSDIRPAAAILKKLFSLPLLVGDKLYPAVSRTQQTQVHLNFSFLLMWAAPASHELAVPDVDLQTSMRSEPQPPADSQSRNPLTNLENK